MKKKLEGDSYLDVKLEENKINKSSNLNTYNSHELIKIFKVYKVLKGCLMQILKIVF